MDWGFGFSVQSSHDLGFWVLGASEFHDLGFWVLGLQSFMILGFGALGFFVLGSLFVWVCSFLTVEAIDVVFSFQRGLTELAYVQHP